MKDNSTSSVWLLAIVTMIAVATLIATNQWTQTLRHQAMQEELFTVLNEIAPTLDYDNNPLAELQHHSDAQGRPYLIYPLRKAGHFVGCLIKSETQSAYNGNLSVLVGIRPDGTSSQVRALEHRETPGLGDRIESHKGDWILQLSGRASDSAFWRLEKDGGQVANLSGATITARATLEAAHRALLYFQQHRSQIIGKN